MAIRRGPLGVILVATMMASTFSLFAVAVLAGPIIDDLGISRAELGLIGSINTGLGALTAPWSGRLTDRIGPRRAVLILLTGSSLALLLMGLSRRPATLLVAAAVGGVPQGWGNPATNALIAATLPPGARGFMTGVKQSGVTLSIFVAGLALPALEGRWDWQAACLVFAGLFAVLTVAVWVLLPSSVSTPAGHPVVDGPSTRPEPLPPFIIRLGVYALLMGLAGGSIGRFLPLFAEEDLGYSLALAGFAASLPGLLGMATRIMAARLAETRIPPSPLLVRLSLIAMASSTLLALAPSSGRWLLWPSVVLYAAGHTAWNAVANLAVIMAVPPRAAGRASGVIILGFLMGLTIAGPVTGAVVDATGDYTIVWWSSVVLAAVSALVLTGHRATEHRDE